MLSITVTTRVRAALYGAAMFENDCQANLIAGTAKLPFAVGKIFARRLYRNGTRRVARMQNTKLIAATLYATIT